MNKLRSRLLPLVAFCAVTGLFAPAAAQANWGAGNKCTNNLPAVPHHCYAYAKSSINTLAVISYENTQEGSYVHECGLNEGAISQELWAVPQSKDAGWLEVGQIMGDGYCDQQPHLFYAEEPPVHPGYKIAVSNSASPEDQFNMYAISDIPYKDGEWYIYYRIPSGSGVWTAAASFGGGWSETTRHEESGMEVVQGQQPLYEGDDEVAYTNNSIQWGTPGWNGAWPGAEYFSEPGSTCIVPLSGAGYASPGNAAEGACG